MLITRYFSWRLVKSHIEMTFVFCSVLFILRLMAELKRVGLGYTSIDALLYVFCMLPSSLASYDSVIAFLATCMWFLQLRASQELVIVQVCGLSMAQLITKMLPAMFAIVGLFSLNREFFAPNLVVYAKAHRAMKVSGGQFYLNHNTMWLRTDQGFLNARIGEDAHVLTNLQYYLFKDDVLLEWFVAPKVIYNKGRWIAPRSERYALLDQGQSKKTFRSLQLPISLKPRVIAWSFLKPDYLSLRKIGESLIKGKKYGISDRITWLMFCVRMVRPVNLLLTMVLSLAVLDRAISLRIMGLSTRLMVLSCIVISEFMLYALMSSSHNALGFQVSAAIAVAPTALLLVLLLLLGLYRYTARAIKLAT